MNVNFSLRGLIIASLVIILVFNGNLAKGDVYNAYMGSISSDEINQGDTLTFAGSIYNLTNSTIIVYAMNATFIELLGESSVRDPERFDYSIDYSNIGFELRTNEIYSDNFNSKIDLNPGKYNVSVGFAATNGTQQSSENWDYYYGVSNQTVQIFGTSESVNIARGIGYLLLGITALIVIYYIYTKFK